jgi:hypothetical protein
MIPENRLSFNMRLLLCCREWTGRAEEITGITGAEDHPSQTPLIHSKLVRSSNPFLSFSMESVRKFMLFYLCSGRLSKLNLLPRCSSSVGGCSSRGAVQLRSDGTLSGRSVFDAPAMLRALEHLLPRPHPSPQPQLNPTHRQGSGGYSVS